MIYGVLFALYDQADTFIDLEEGGSIDKAELDYPYMPPFVGTEEEMEMLVEYLADLAAQGSTKVAEKGAE
jgi:hypothetical protein